MTQHLVRGVVTYTVLLGVSAGTVAAQTGAPDDAWSSSVALYLHASDLSGAVTRGPVDVPVDVSFSTLLDKLNTAFTIHGETQRGRFGVGVDYFYFGLGETAIATPLANVSVEEANLDLKNFELFGFGRVGAPTQPSGAFDVLAGVETWIIGTLVDEPHPTHAHVDKALAWIARVKPKRAVLTHLSELLDYDALGTRLPDGVEPAYDGMVVEAPAR